MPAVQESDCIVRRLWHGLICDLGLPTDQLTLDTIWGRFEEFCKPQSNEVHARFDLLTSFRQGSHSIDEWYNVVQGQVNLAKYPPETSKILHRDIFWIFLWDEEFVSRTISDGSVDLDKFTASRVQQLAKILESSKATVCHIKQVAGDSQAAQIPLLTPCFTYVSCYNLAVT